MNNEKLKRIAYIYTSGYSTWCDFTLEEWFKARGLYHTNKTACLRAVGINQK